MNRQASLFDGQRLRMDQALELTIESLALYGPRYPHWAIAYSGGKDSSATVAVVAHLIRSGQIPAPESLSVLYADTRMELPPLQASATGMLAALRAQGVDARVVLPPMDERFWVYMLGRGVPPPKNRFRWCTSRLKIEPMEAALEDRAIALGYGERVWKERPRPKWAYRGNGSGKLLMLTGVRLGESAVRDSRILTSCSRDGAECGQGWFQESISTELADTLAPLLHWRVCHVWDWLTFNAPSPEFGGYPTAAIADAYGGDEAEEVNARTGCICCPLASNDRALDAILNPRLSGERWQYLAPLKELRDLWPVLWSPVSRLRKPAGERRKDGTLSSNQHRMGPLTLEARRAALATVLSIQARVNAGAAPPERPVVDILNAEEVGRIEALIDANTWPEKWDGTEPVATEPFTEHGQQLLWGELAAGVGA